MKRLQVRTTVLHRSVVRALRAGVFATVLGLSLSTAALAQTSEPVVFDIPAQPLATALKTFAEQAGMQLLYRPETISGVAARPVQGQYDKRQALQKLLEGSNLEIVYSAENAATIRPRAKEATTKEVNTEGAAATYDFDIPSQELSAALRVFTRVTGQQVEFDKAQVRGKVSILLEGSYTADEAIEILLKGTGLTARRGAQGALVLEEAAHLPETLGVEEGITTLEEIVVTGTLIRGAHPIGSDLIQISREDIEKSGFSTIQDVIRALPQNSSAGAAEYFVSGREGETNSYEGTAVNLRGIGAGGTLVLVNGRRLAPGGVQGFFTDVSNIPLSAVERVEVLLDGASAIYGSDAVGGVVNVILRKDFSGAETLVEAGTVSKGSTHEYRFGQTVGMAWGSGNALLSYEFYQRSNLSNSERDFTANSDLRPLGGDNFSSTFSNPATILTGGTTYAIPRGQDGTSLTPADFEAGTTNFGNQNEGTDLLPKQRRNSIFGTASQQVGDRLTLSAEALITIRDSVRLRHAPANFTRVTSANPFYVNPAGGTETIFILYDFQTDFGSQRQKSEIRTYSTGLLALYEISDRWSVTAEAGYGRDDSEFVTFGVLDPGNLAIALVDPNPETAFNPFGDGPVTNPATIAAIQGKNEAASSSDLWTARLVTNGTLYDLPGGALKQAIGVEYREYDFKTGFNSIRGAGVSQSLAEFGRSQVAAFAELSIPLVGSNNRRPGVERLAFSLAGRYERYSDFGTTFNPKIGAEWAPIPAITFRGNWSTSFTAPNLFDLNEADNISGIVPVLDPSSPFGFSEVLIWAGGNADLEEERSTNWSVGVTLAPPEHAGRRITLNYFQVDYKNRIESIADPFVALIDPSLDGIVIRNPTIEQRQTVCSRSMFSGSLEDCLNAPIAAIVDGRINNSSIVRTNGLDLIGSFDVKSGSSIWDFGINATYLFDYSRTLRETTPLVELLDTPFNPPDLKIRGTASWMRGGFQAAAFVNYVDSYKDTRSEPNRRVDSWATLDATLSYRVPVESNSIISGTTFKLSAQNIFDNEPPFLNNPSGLGFDGANANPLGRFISFSIRKEW